MKRITKYAMKISWFINLVNDHIATTTSNTLKKISTHLINVLYILLNPKYIINQKSLLMIFSKIFRYLVSIYLGNHWILAEAEGTGFKLRTKKSVNTVFENKILRPILGKQLVLLVSQFCIHMTFALLSCNYWGKSLLNT